MLACLNKIREIYVCKFTSMKLFNKRQPGGFAEEAKIWWALKGTNIWLIKGVCALDQLHRLQASYYYTFLFSGMEKGIILIWVLLTSFFPCLQIIWSSKRSERLNLRTVRFDKYFHQITTYKISVCLNKPSTNFLQKKSENSPIFFIQNT